MTSELTPLQKERREKILMAAANYFATVHFHEADMEQIKKSGGISGSNYHICGELFRGQPGGFQHGVAV